MKQNNSNRMNHRNNRVGGSRGGEGEHNRGRNHSPRSQTEGHINGGRGRGNPRQMREKYITLAQEAIAAGNHIDAETYYQHADHYYRLTREEYGSNAGNERVENVVRLPIENDEEGGESSSPEGLAAE